MAPASSLLLLVIYHLSLLSFADGQPGFNPSCPPFPCGILSNIKFPFTTPKHPECGLLIVENCKELSQRKIIQLGKDGPRFYLDDIKQDNTIVLRDRDHIEHIKNHTCGSFKNLTLSSSPFYSFEFPPNVTMFKCFPFTPHNLTDSYNICNDSSQSIFYYTHPTYDLPSPPAQCSVFVPLLTKTEKHVFLYNIYTDLFFLRVNVTKECHDCHFSRGQCQSDINGNFNCSGAKSGSNSRGAQCQNDVNGNFSCSGTKTGNAKGHIIVVAIAITASGIGVLIILALCFTKKLSSINSMVIWEKKFKNNQNIEAFLRNHGSLALKRYNYSDIMRMTNSFKHKLGQGGYGGVFKGKLLDGRDVAVKVLNGSKGNGEDFINEVASISRTSHVNIIGLFGYCFESNKRALIYEFVPNGSLEKFIYEKYSTHKQLNWEKLHQIALGIARGLEYLHRGCSTRIVHLDIKPHNILLDEDFCPKISDFGLAKICPKRESIISMTGARGTIGYIAPEVFCRNFGEVSHKSDVYSYGMMILEMVGGRKNFDVGVDQTSQTYFPHWIYERLEVGEELGLHDIENEEENKCARKMLMVSLWCIQTNPSSRPTMTRVVELLEASLDSLQFPPKPFLSSPRSERADSLWSLVS